MTVKHFIAAASAYWHTGNTTYYLSVRIWTFSLRLNKVFCRDIFVYFKMAPQGSYIQGNIISEVYSEPSQTSKMEPIFIKFLH